MVTVLLTTSGTGSRLGERTAFTNKSLLKVGDVYAITHIVRLYPPNTEFIITLGHFGNHVRQYIELAHPTLDVKFVEVDNFKDPGSSLGYSMLKAKGLLQKPFYFHCCDTLLQEKVELVDTNCLYGAKGSDTTTYSSFTLQNETGYIYESQSVVSLHSKGAKRADLCYIGVCYMKDYGMFWKELEDLYEKDPLNSSLSDVHAIQRLLLNRIPFTSREVPGWFDTGNQESFEKTRKAFACEYNVLEKPDESLCFLENQVIKFFSDPITCKKRVERGHLLYPYGPKLLGFTDNFFVMEKIDGTPVGESVQYNELANLLEWTWNALWSRQSKKSSYKEQCAAFYKTKTYKRLNSLVVENERLYVNGFYTGSWRELLDQVDFSFLETDTFSYFHGDFILDNILKTKDSYVLLDWRQDFDGNLEYGDMAYDLAKLRHNLYFNHGNILADLYHIGYNGEGVSLDIQCHFALLKQEADLQSFCKDKQIPYEKIQILTSLIWLNMAPLYTGKLSEFLFYFGKYTLASTLRSSVRIL